MAVPTDGISRYLPIKGWKTTKSVSDLHPSTLGIATTRQVDLNLSDYNSISDVPPPSSTLLQKRNEVIATKLRELANPPAPALICANSPSSQPRVNCHREQQPLKLEVACR